jgi:hypothetical protein
MEAATFSRLASWAVAANLSDTMVTGTWTVHHTATQQTLAQHPTYPSTTV